MTDQPAAIQACFSDFRIVKGRKVAQLVLEVSLEQADNALTILGGIPQQATERWVAVARLNGVAKPEPKPDKEKQKWDDLKLSMQAGIRCEEKAFQRYFNVKDAESAAEAVRLDCGVDSRSGLNDNPEAAAKWIDLDRSYQAWLRMIE